MNRKFFRSLLLWLLLCCMLAPVSLAEEEIIGYGELELYSEGAFPAPPAERPAMFSARTKTVQQTIYDGMMAQEEKISISAYGIMGEDLESLKSALGAVVQDVVNNEPDLFFIDSSYGFSYIPSEDGLIAASISPRYLYTGEEFDSEMAAYNSAVNAIVKDAQKADTVVGQLLRINEHLCLNYEYDNSLTIRKANEFFKQGTGVCQAYTLAYKAVCDRLGIESTTASSSAMNHIWNMVYVDGEWYHIDVTWNDPTPDSKLFAYHEFFMRSDDAFLSASPKHYGWVSHYEATSEKYDSVGWLELGVPVSVVGDKVYYTNVNSTLATIRACDLSDLSVEDLYNYNIYSYLSLGVPCCSNGVRVYFPLDHEVYSVDMNGEDLRLEYMLGDTSMKIRSMVISGDNLTMSVTGDSGTEIITVKVDVPLTMTISPAELTMQPGETMALPVAISPEPEAMPVLTYESSQPLVISFDEDGVMTAGVPGQATVTAKYSETIFASGVVTVHREDAAILPANTREIRDGAFSGMPVVEFILPEGVEEIGSGAFADCDNLLYINLPDSLTDVAEDAFDEDSGVTLIVTSGAYAQEFAESSGLNTAVLNPAVTETTETTEAEETADE